ncbi:protein WVD2-like 7 [Andrographis paniculata]|uniref:protein WVD2-like 7 n=1 Tax=Andrographis paniculata TaxID=175694 RepID=UPI0021E74426|nr:protein WVD2-like 7 [Andrographis paniculata]
MDGPVNSSARLEVSVSFGKFENNGVSLEKWSSFSPNKYLEEAGNLSTPGSVAQKKAYFEAHYKKKAEELEQEKLMGCPVLLSSDMSRNESYAISLPEVDQEFSVLNEERLVEEIAQEAHMTPLTNGSTIVYEAEDDCARLPVGVEGGSFVNVSADAISLEEEKEDAAVVVKCGSPAVDETKDDMNGNVEGAKLDIRRYVQPIRPETFQKGSQETVKNTSGRKNGNEQSGSSRKQNSKLNAWNAADKATPSKKEKTLVGKTKKIGPIPVKQSETSFPRYSKPLSEPAPTSASKTFRKPVHGSQLASSKNSQVGESRRAAPTSLHMSMNLGSAKSLSAISATRKSLIMEKMRDKDIVKPAFRTFQNQRNDSISDGKHAKVKQMMSTSVDLKNSASSTPTQGNAGLRRGSEKQATQRSQLGTHSKPLCKGSYRNPALDMKSKAAFSPAARMRSDGKAEKPKEL